MIGIFDSGIGGLTIAKAIIARLPQYDYMYLGDNARAPYGDHSQDIILRHTIEAVTYLFEHGCNLVLLACNTASAEALRTIQQEWLPKHYPGKNVIGVIRPLSEQAALQTKNDHVGVMATRSTVASHAYLREVQAQKKSIEVTEQACRLLVPLIEDGFAGKPELRMILKKYVRPLKERGIDTLILGCTHYDLIASDIRRYVGSRVQILDSGAIISEKFQDYLERHPEYETMLSRKGSVTFLTTADAKTIAERARRFWGSGIDFKQIALS